MLLAVLLLAAAEVSAAADNRTCSAAELDSHERAFWACLGPWGYSSGAHDILLVNTSMSHMSMDMGVGSGHVHDAEFCYSLIGESNFCVCTAPLRQLAQCGLTLAAETLESYQPWCQAKRSCPELAPELLKTSMMCTAEGLNAANESDVICAYEHELVQEAMRDRVQALNEQLTSGHYHLPAGMHLPHLPPPSPPGTAHGQCGHAVKDLFNASMRVNQSYKAQRGIRHSSRSRLARSAATTIQPPSLEPSSVVPQEWVARARDSARRPCAYAAKQPEASLDDRSPPTASVWGEGAAR